MSTPILEERFELERPLRHTDFSTVYLASDRRYLHRPHCLVTAIRYHQREMRHRLEREAQILERLGHQPQIPALIAYFYRESPSVDSSSAESANLGNNLSDNTFYLVQDHIVGHPLSQELIVGKPLSESYVTKLLQDVLTALISIHQQGVVHQNLQPQNLIRQSLDGQIFVTEFGELTKLARSRIAADGSLGSTVPTALPPYAAPEQIHVEQPDQESWVGPQPTSDLYALGLIAVEALTGQRHQDFIYDPQTGLRWREQQGDINLHLAEFVDRLIRHHWQDRFETAEAALQTLRQSCDRYRVAHDSRLDTVVAAPGINPSAAHSTLQPQAIATEIGIHAFSTPLPIAKGNSKFPSTRPTPSVGLTNPIFLKLVIGSVVATLALGVGVKAYQWGEYQVSHLPQTWQKWRSANRTYPAAAEKDLVPLLADGSLMLRPSAVEAFWNMAAAAANEGVELYALSAHQAETAATTAEPDYATGYALDIGGETETSDRQVSFAKTQAFQWLQANAQTYGFTLAVPGDRLIGSGSTEPWHWRYVGDDASEKIFGTKADHQ